MTPQELERQQEIAHAEIAEAIKSGEARIAALDQHLRDEVLKERTAQIKAEVEARVAERRKAIAERAERAKAMQRRFTPEAARRAALDGLDATARLATFATLQRCSTGELVERLQDAIEGGNTAMAEAIRLEFQGRDDREALRERFTTLFGQLRSPETDEAVRALRRVEGLAAVADQRLVEFIRGQSDPMTRLAAARLAGTPRAA